MNVAIGAEPLGTGGGRRRVACLVGTRPEAIKMGPVIAALRRDSRFETQVVATGQHRELLRQALGAFAIACDVDLDVMEPGQGLTPLLARLLARLDRYLEQHCPEIVLAQGDTTTVLATAIACFHRRIPFGHVEAGLRSHDATDPFPEEMNRTLVARLARLHFAPLESNRKNLLAEGIDDSHIFVVGNTIVDAVLAVVAHRAAPPVAIPAGLRPVLLTVHRRESHGAPLEGILRAVRALVDRHPDVCVIWPVHPSPHVSEPARRLLGGHARVLLLPPLEYPALIATLARVTLVLTDSGGLQEEAPVLGVPVLVLRQVTERPEAIAAGAARLVGVDSAAILKAAEDLLTNDGLRTRMAAVRRIFGDGRAAERIVAATAEHVLQGQRPVAAPIDCPRLA